MRLAIQRGRDGQSLIWNQARQATPGPFKQLAWIQRITVPLIEIVGARRFKNAIFRDLSGLGHRGGTLICRHIGNACCTCKSSHQCKSPFHIAHETSRESSCSRSTLIRALQVRRCNTNGFRKRSECYKNHNNSSVAQHYRVCNQRLALSAQFRHQSAPPALAGDEQHLHGVDDDEGSREIAHEHG